MDEDGRDLVVAPDVVGLEVRRANRVTKASDPGLV
jgi:hypothetical protein